ncbi:hypothetical protein D1BOALGB6SA_10642 [Olavius sp. associated proteobacterium Delta 1]|nr:hypothetical protein D1BOALGB6SA_10642 [Olavius sp. associated proteobacterium Delta 1]
MEPGWRAPGGLFKNAINPYPPVDYKETNTNLAVIRQEVIYSTHLKTAIIAAHRIHKS